LRCNTVLGQNSAVPHFNTHFFPLLPLKTQKVRKFGAKSRAEIIGIVRKQVFTLIKRKKWGNVSSNLFTFCWFLSYVRHFWKHVSTWVMSRWVLNAS